MSYEVIGTWGFGLNEEYELVEYHDGSLELSRRSSTDGSGLALGFDSSHEAIEVMERCISWLRLRRRQDCLIVRGDQPVEEKCGHCNSIYHTTDTCGRKPTFLVKDSGTRQAFESGMVRDTSEGKTQYHRTLEGPMFDRWAEHLTKGAVKYPDRENGEANWTLANGPQEEMRFKQSALRHFIQWFRGERDEDHAAAVFFNINGAEYVRAQGDNHND